MGPRFRKRGNVMLAGCAQTSLTASMGPRFRKRGNELNWFYSALPTVLLQWGRAFGSAETLVDCLLLTPDLYASMGPRFRKRGNFAAFIAAAPPELQLQWGRAFGSAETLREVLPLAVAHESLQWGRAFGSAETGLGFLALLQPAPASMGPRFRKRGNPCSY